MQIGKVYQGPNVTSLQMIMLMGMVTTPQLKILKVNIANRYRI